MFTRCAPSLLERLQPGPAGPIVASPDEVSSRRRRISAIVYFGMMAVYAAVVQLTDPIGQAY